MTATILTTLYLVTTTIYSAPCVPANTCFEGVDHQTSDYDSSYILTCNAGGIVERTLHRGSLTCNSDDTTTATVSEINTGDENKNGGSGSISVDFLQGTNCPINQVSESCSNYMVLRHRGTPSYEDTSGVAQPYLDIGDNCVNYIGSESTFTQSTSVVVPVGCVNRDIDSFTGGSYQYYCDATKWGYTRYDDANCQGAILTAQSDEWAVDECGFFTETTHCQNGQTTGCANGVTVSWYYWYDLECCPINGKTCSGSALGSSPSGTPAPVSPTPKPTGPGLKGTSSPSSPTPASPTSDVNGKCIFYGLLIVIGVVWNM